MPGLRKKFGLDYLLPTEWVLIGYLLITAVFILFFVSTLEKEFYHLVYRLLAVVFILIFSSANRKQPENRFILFARLGLPFFLFTFLYTETDYLNNLLFVNNFDPLIASWEHKLFSFQPSLQFSVRFPSTYFAELMYLGYFSYYILVVGVPFYIFLKIGASKGLHAMFIVICSFLFYYIFFIIFPVAGPQYYFPNALGNLPDGYLFGWAMRIIQQLGEAPTAAFPSSHVGVCMLLLILGYINAKGIMVLVVPVSILLLMSTVYIKAHYLIDVFAGILSAPLVYFLSNWLFRVLNGAKEKGIANYEHTN